MTNRFISNISQDVNRVLLGLKSRIAPFRSRISSDSILSRICLASLIWLFLILGGFSTRAWAAAENRNIYASTAVVGGVGGTAKVEIKWYSTSVSKGTVGTPQSTKGSTLVTTGSTERHGGFLDPWPDFWVEFTATPDDGYFFEGWYTNPEGTSGEVCANPYTTASTKGPIEYVTYYAKFSLKKNVHVPLTYMQKSFDNDYVTVVKSGSSEWGDIGTETQHLAIGSSDGGTGDKYVIIHFEGIPDKLTFYFKTSDGGNGNKDARFYVMESANNDMSSNPGDGYRGTGILSWDTVQHQASSWGTLQTIQLQPTTRYVKIYYNGKGYGRIKDIQISELNAFDADINTLDFGLQGYKYGVQEKTFNFDHANAGRETNVAISGADAGKFSVDPTTIPGTGRDLYGSRTLKVRFNNNDEGRAENEYYTATLTISDNSVPAQSETIALRGRRNGKNVPEFTWNPNHVPYYFDTIINTPVVSSNTQTGLTLVSSNTNVAEIVDGKLKIKSTSSSVTITVTQGETDDYRAHSENFTFTPREAPPVSAPFVMTKSYYDNSKVATYKGSDCSWTGDNYIALGGSNWEAYASGRYFDSRKQVVITFGGTPATLSFTAKNTYCSIKCRWKVEESYDGVNWSEVFYKEKSCKEDVVFSDIALKPTTQYLRFSYGGNYTGYIKNINVTSLDGYKYLLTDDGKYLSRGSNWGTHAVVGEFGVPIRITRFTSNNSNYFTQVQFMDSHDFLYATGDDIYTDAGAREGKNFIQTLDGGKVYVTNSDGTKYITIDENDKLVLTDKSSLKTKWTIEDYTLHKASIDAKLDRMAATAAEPEFGAEMNTLARVRAAVAEQDFEFTKCSIPALALGEHNGTPHPAEGVAAVYSNTIDTLTPGFYRLTVQALYRPTTSPYDWENHSKEMESVVAHVFANDVKYPIKSVFDKTGAHGVQNPGDTLCSDGYYYPANLSSADAIFSDNDGAYLNDVYVYVPADEGRTKGTLVYGIKNPSYVPGEWLAYKNITLTRIARKEFIFNGGAGTEEWDKDGNWNKGKQPNEHNIAIIQADLTITEEVKAYSVKIEKGAVVTIAPTGGLKLGAGGVQNATKANFKLTAGTGTNGYAKGLTSYLRISPNCTEMPIATVEVFSKAFYDRASGEDNIAAWQCLGSPIEGDTLAKKVFTQSWIYNWDETIDDEEKADGGWKNTRSKLRLAPFTGYLTTQEKHSEGTTLTFTGKLVSTEDSIYVKLSREATGRNFLANSYTAPIAISNFNSSDFVDTEQTIYILNTGSRKDELEEDYSKDAPGKFVAIPINTAAKLADDGYPVTIAPLQGFMVKAKMTDQKCDSSALKFNYKRLVYDVDYTEEPYVTPQPLRAPKRTKQADNDDFGKMKITLEADGWTDYMYLLESEDYNERYEDGYDAHKIFSEGAEIFAVEGDEEYMSIDATNSIIGTRVGVRTSNETAYTLSFSNLRNAEDVAIVDMEADEVINISEGMQYTFFAEPNAMITDRFLIVEGDNVPAITTGVDNVKNGAKVHKFIKDNQLFILKDGVLYNAFGAVVR